MTAREALRVERSIAASPAEVFAAWADAESLALWMRPGDIGTAKAEVDFRVGGRFRITMVGTEQDYVHTGEYLEIDPPHRLVFTWFSQLAADVRTVVTVEIESDGPEGSRLLLVHEDLTDADPFAGYAEGWGSILERLSEHFA